MNARIWRGTASKLRMAAKAEAADRRAQLLLLAEDCEAIADQMERDETTRTKLGALS